MGGLLPCIQPVNLVLFPNNTDIFPSISETDSECKADMVKKQQQPEENTQ